MAETGTLCPGFRPPPSAKHDESEREGSRDWTMGKTLVAVNNGQSTSSRRIFGSLGSSEPSAVANASAPAISASGNVPRSDHYSVIFYFLLRENSLEGVRKGDISMTLHKRFCGGFRVFQAVGAYRLTSPRLLDTKLPTYITAWVDDTVKRKKVNRTKLRCCPNLMLPVPGASTRPP